MGLPRELIKSLGSGKLSEEDLRYLSLSVGLGLDAWRALKFPMCNAEVDFEATRGLGWD
jgi:hypothetical protein